MEYDVWLGKLFTRGCGFSREKGRQQGDSNVSLQLVFFLAWTFPSSSSYCMGSWVSSTLHACTLSSSSVFSCIHSVQRCGDEIPIPFTTPVDANNITCTSSLLSQQATGDRSTAGQVAVAKPPPSDETPAQLARRLRAAVREERDLTEFRDLITIRPPGPAIQAQ